jgi:hypothetical protein
MADTFSDFCGTHHHHIPPNVKILLILRSRTSTVGDSLERGYSYVEFRAPRRIGIVRNLNHDVAETEVGQEDRRFFFRIQDSIASLTIDY